MKFNANHPYRIINLLSINGNRFKIQQKTRFWLFGRYGDWNDITIKKSISRNSTIYFKSKKEVMDFIDLKFKENESTVAEFVVYDSNHDINPDW